MGLGAQNRAMAMPKRFRLSAHVALTLISFVTTGRAPRLLAFGARDLATLEKRTDRSRCSFDLCGAVDANPIFIEWYLRTDQHDHSLTMRNV
jgi:hypothetical protein